MDGFWKKSWWERHALKSAGIGIKEEEAPRVKNKIQGEARISAPWFRA
ncbi:hypothetical protein JCM10550A_02750 [Methanogenium cariaci]